MPYARPSPQQTRDRLAAEFELLFEGSDPRRRRSVEAVMVRALAIVSDAMHGHIAWAGRQMHVATADIEELEIRAAVWGIARNAAVAAGGDVVLSGAAGVTVPPGVELRRSDDASFTTTAACVIGGGGAGTVRVLAAEPGATSNTAAATTLAMIEPIAGVQSSAVVDAGGITGGLDRENLESLRARTRERIQDPPAGGAAHDYRAWVQDVVGQTRVWVQPYTPMPGWVTVLFLMPDGAIPGPATVDAVAAAIEAQRPVTATGVHVLAPVPHLVDFSIALSPDTVANRTAVLAALDDFLLREAEPGGTLPLSRISAAISAADGEYSHDLIAPAAAVASPTGEIARRGTVTWL